MWPMTRIWFTADHHLDHENIIRFCSRPFDNAGHMNAALIDNWNAVVKPADTVYHLGDLTLGGLGVAKNYLRRLNGRVILLANWTHHDKRWLKPLRHALACAAGWPCTASGAEIELAEPLITIKVGGQIIVACHFPLARWDREHYGSIHLHAHSHGRHHAEGKILDGGVDSAWKHLGAYRPFSLEEVVRITREGEQ